jgi:hypothetical protein|tara:strand:+ start:1205 stop:2086 length:882 start_codon:yes stop_codon:yes gene_type:complete
MDSQWLAFTGNSQLRRSVQGNEDDADWFCDSVSPMTSTLLILGDSLMDAGNVSRATDDLVLGEQIAIAMGGDPEDVQLFPLQDSLRPQSAQLHNYAHGGAQSGSGFKQQVRAVRRHADVYQSLSDVDLLISAGANDLLDQLEDSSAFMAALDTEDRRDDRQLMRRNAKRIARNLRRGVDRLTGLVDDVVVTGAFPLTATPEVQSLADAFDSATFDRLVAIVDGIGAKVQRKLERHFASNDSVAVLNLKAAWDRLEAPDFVDAVHPSSETSRELADLIVPDLVQQLNSFGFAEG